MVVLVVFDSVFGNTAQVAKAIETALTPSVDVRLTAVADAGDDVLEGADLMIVGSPTRGFRPTPKMMEFVSGLDADRLNALPAATFDTRMDLADIHPAPLRWVVDAGGYAADVLAKALTRRGAVALGTPAGFLVGGTEGPLKPGEIERAEAWARDILAAVPSPAAT